jgi:hypothetical protein
MFFIGDDKYMFINSSEITYHIPVPGETLI